MYAGDRIVAFALNSSKKTYTVVRQSVSNARYSISVVVDDMVRRVALGEAGSGDADGRKWILVTRIFAPLRRLMCLSLSFRLF